MNDTIILTHGKHKAPEQGRCAMEAVAFLAGEPHSDAPQCACPALTAFARMLNDGRMLPGARWPTNVDRTEALMPAVFAMVGSRSTPATERARAAYLIDCALRWYAPLALMAAVGACEARGIDCTALRDAGLRLCEEPTRANAEAASKIAHETWAVPTHRFASTYHPLYFAELAVDTAAVAIRQHLTDYSAEAASYAACAVGDGGLLVLRLAAEHLLAACAITAETIDSGG